MSLTMKQTLAEKTADKILHIIQDEKYEPGQKLPTEKELCARTCAGRNTVREAVKILASGNVVSVRQGSGIFVSEKQGISDDPFGFKMSMNPEKLTKDLLQVRIMIEPPIAAVAAQNATTSDIAELKKLLTEFENTVSRHEDFTEGDVAFHIQIARCTHNQVMEHLIPVITGGVMQFAKTVKEAEYEQTLRSHLRIYHAIRDHRSVDAEQEMSFHLHYNRNRYE